MPVPKIENINYCRVWIRICSSFADVEYQRRCWFRMEGREVSSFEEDFTHMDFALKILSDSQRDHYLNKKCNDLLNQFVEKLYKYREDPHTDFILAEEENLLNDPRWLEIVKSAQQAEIALKRFEQEMELLLGKVIVHDAV